MESEKLSLAQIKFRIQSTSRPQRLEMDDYFNSEYFIK